jgi:uncharacterized protein with PQ loop repeat
VDFVAAVIVSTFEYQNFGLNVLTISFLVTVGFTFFLQLPGLVSQAQTLWKNKSAEGVEMLTFIAFFSYFLVTLIYMFSISSVAGIINSLTLLPPQIFILAALFKYKKIRLIDVAVGAIGAVLVAGMLVPEWRAVIFTSASILVFFALLLQPLTMLRTKSVLNIAVSFPRNFAVVTLVWTIYGLTIGDWYVAGSSGAFMLVYLLTTVLWYRYRTLSI